LFLEERFIERNTLSGAKSCYWRFTL